MRCSGCAFASACAIASFPSIGAAIADSEMDGAIALTRTFGAYSAARARVSPSTAPLALETTAWLVKPCCTATVENSTTEPPFFFSGASTAFSASAAPTTWSEKQFK